MNTQLLVFIAIVAVTAGVWSWKKPKWMGFRGKSLWDWLSLLAVPSLIGFATVLITAAQADLERVRLQELAIQHYIDRISELSMDVRAESHPEQVLAIGRAQTVAILHVTDKDRTARVLQFLQEMNLLQKYAVSLEVLDLVGADLKGLQLDGLDFEGSILRGADMENGSFRNADFEDADLRDADLEDADFRGADFENARMKGAELDHTDLRAADLSLAIGLTLSQLDDSCVDESTVLPVEFKPVASTSTACNGSAGD